MKQRPSQLWGHEQLLQEGVDVAGAAGVDQSSVGLAPTTAD